MKIIFLWNNYGPTHADRVDAVATAYGHTAECIGIEEQSLSDTYDWVPEGRDSFQKITLFGKEWPGTLKMLFALVKKDFQMGKATWFLCNYDRLHIFLFAIWLRLRFRSVFLMGCSKYDDFPRHARREFIKSFAFLPYSGAISSGRRSVDYFRSLGLVSIHCEYNTVDISRVRSLTTHPPAPLGVPFAARDFIIVARLVEKKNIFTALDAFSKYRLLSKNPRKLRICGSGPLEYVLKQHAAKIGVSESVFFEGFVQTDAVSKFMGTSLALILPSTEEQFGNVVIEAQAMGLPVLISQVCGACDNLVRNWVNGFVFEPDNPDGLAGFMSLIDRDEALWRKLCLGATDTAPKGDVARFVDAVSALTGHKT